MGKATVESLARLFPRASARLAAPLLAAMAEFAIESPFQQAAFLANAGHESGGMTRLEEGLSYSAERLMTVWPTRFPTLASAVLYARNPEALANHVYAGRNGNGDEASGDGWAFRGSGLMELTGRAMHARCARELAVNLSSVSAWMRTDPEGAARSAAWFWMQAGCNGATSFDHACDLVNLGHITERVGDALGFADRLALFQSEHDILCSSPTV